MKKIFLLLTFCVSYALVKAQDFQPFHQIFLQDTVLDIKKIEYENDTTGRRLGFKLSEDKTVIQLFNYDGQSKVKIIYTSKSGSLKDVSRYKCNIHSLPHL